MWQLVEDELWGTSAEVDGLFVDPEPARRERFTLVDCQPLGGLARALVDGRPTMVAEISAFRAGSCAGRCGIRWSSTTSPSRGCSTGSGARTATRRSG